MFWIILLQFHLLYMDHLVNFKLFNLQILTISKRLLTSFTKEMYYKMTQDLTALYMLLLWYKRRPQIGLYNCKFSSGHLTCKL